MEMLSNMKMQLEAEGAFGHLKNFYILLNSFYFLEFNCVWWVKTMKLSNE